MGAKNVYDQVNSESGCVFSPVHKAKNPEILDIFIDNLQI